MFLESNNDSKNFGSYNEPLINLNQRTNQESGRNDENIRVDYTLPFNSNKGKLEKWSKSRRNGGNGPSGMKVRLEIVEELCCD